MSLVIKPTSVMPVLLAARVVNRLGGAGMGFLGVRLVRDLGVPLSTTATVLAVFGACTVPSRVLGGVLATRWGPRAALVGGLVAAGLAQFVIAAGSTLTVVVVGVVLLGLAYEVVEPATQAAVATGVEPENRAAQFSLLWASISVAGVAAGVVAALVTPWGIAALFAVDALTSLLAAAVVALLLPRLPVVQVDRPWRLALTRPVLAWATLCTVPATVIMLVVFMLPVVVERGGWSPALTGWLLATAAASAIGAQRVLSPRWHALPDHLVLATGFGLLAVALGTWSLNSVSALFAGAVVEGVAGTLVVGTQQAVASRLATPGAEAAVMTVHGLSWGVATVLAPVAGALLLGHGASTLWLTAAAVTAVLAVGHARPPASLVPALSTR